MYQRILVPIDGSSTSNKGLEEAIRLAKLTGGTIRLLHVVEELIITAGYEGYAMYTGEFIDALIKSGKQILEDGKAKLAATGVKGDAVLLERATTRAAEAVLEQAKDWRADLIVIGTHGRRGVSRLFMGSDAEQILRLSPVPVLLVRAPESNKGSNNSG